MILSTTALDIKWSPITYISEWPFLSWISEPNYNNKAAQLTPWIVCREIHIGYLKGRFTKLVANVNKTRFALGKTYLKKEMPPKKWAGIVSYDNRSMATAIHVLNLIEKEVGWELTTITKTKADTTDHLKANTYLVAGPIEWMGAIPLMSLYLLIIRSCWSIEFHRIKRIEDIKTACEKLIKKKGNTAKEKNHIADIRKNYKYWLLLILNTEFMFGGRSHKSLYAENSRTMGITALAEGSTYIDNITIKRWHILVAKGKPWITK